MLDRFIQALLQEIIQILIQKPNFFELESSDKKEFLKELRIPSTVKEYLEETSLENFLTDTRQFVEYTKNRNLTLSENNLLKAVANFLVNSFANDIYALPVEYFKLGSNEQKAIVEKLITSDSMLGTTLREILVNNSAQEISNNVQQFLHATIKTPLVIIQSPVEIEAEAKKEMQKQISEELEIPCFPIFQVNRNLIGGLRIFVNGVVKDYSWIKSINFITSLK